LRSAERRFVGDGRCAQNNRIWPSERFARLLDIHRAEQCVALRATRVHDDGTATPSVAGSEIQLTVNVWPAPQDAGRRHVTEHQAAAVDQALHAADADADQPSSRP
jgi:hypothetical protein